MWKFSSFWYKDFDGMAKKTLLRQLISKWGIMSTEMVQAMEGDGSLNESSGGAIISTPEDSIPIDQPEATDVVENISLEAL